MFFEVYKGIEGGGRAISQDRLSQTFNFARNLLASSPTFQEIIGAPSEAHARSKVYSQEALDEQDEELIPGASPDDAPAYEPRPRGIIGIRQDQMVLAGTQEWAGTGILLFSVEAFPPADLFPVDGDTSSMIRQKFRERRLWGMQKCGMIEDEMRHNKGRSASDNALYLNAVDFQVDQPPADPEEGDQAGNYLGWTYAVTWR